MRFSKTLNEFQKRDWLNFFFGFSTVSFIFLSLLHYFSRRPLWSDEAWVFESVQKLSFRELFGTLIGAQVFPRVYLFCVKFTAMPWDYNLLALRFFSLIFMVSAFFVWRKIYLAEFGRGQPALVAILSFVFSNQLTYYAAELKPYSMDVLAVGLYCFFAYYQKDFQDKNPTAGLYCGAALLPFLFFFSYGALFVFGIAGLNFLWLLRKNKRLYPVFLVNAAMSLLCLAILYKIDLQYSVTQKGLYDYWKDYFLGTHSFYAFIAPFGEGIREQATWWFGRYKFFIRAATPFVPLFVYGLARFGFGQWKKDKGAIFSIGSMGAFIFLELVVLSLFKKYPFTGDRITLFLAPFVFFFIVQGIDSLKKFRRVSRVVLSYYVVFLTACAVSSVIFYINLYAPRK